MFTKDYKFEKTAVLNNDVFHHFGIHPSTITLYGDSIEDIVLVIMKVSNDQTIPSINEKRIDPDYWGWFNNENMEFSSMIYGQRFLLNMCFPSGIKASEDAGNGKAYRLEIVEIKDYNT